MKNLIFQERKSKIESLQKNINMINTESKVRQPHSSLKTLFNGTHPKNRKNLKKLDVILPNTVNKNVKNKLSQRPEFLSLEKPNNYKGVKILPLNHFSSSSTLYSLNNNQNQNVNQNNLNINMNGNFDNLDLKFLNSAESLPRLTSKKVSKISQNKKSVNEIQPEKDLNQLYQEFIDDVSNIIQ